ncbi:MAG TPA: BatD family protein [Rhodanobacteraceae bacterium]|nr:BatD family protein [Rhodanobacteraceae bacterium]
MKLRFLPLLLLLLAVLAHAAPAGSSGLHAFLDRDHAALGDTVTLNVEGADALSGTPDLSPLRRDFDVLGTSSSSKVEIVNGASRSSTQLGIALRPKHAGTLTIPSLRIGNRQTQPLTLQVTPAPNGALGNVGDPAFLQDSVDSTTPYVGQQIVYTLQLFYTGNLTGGQLEDPQADGAQVIHLNGDTRYQTTRGGQTYQVVERHYALIPQRAGRIVVRGPTFLGQMLSQNRSDRFDSFFDDGTPVQARADDITLDARAVPANAGTPWLPAQSVQLKMTGLPDNGRVKAGEPLTLTLSVDAVGTSVSRLPQLQLPPLDGARIYPDQPQDATRDDGHWLRATRTRSFAIVPNRGGTLTIPAITLNWWNVKTDQSEQARLPAHTLTVVGAAGNVTQQRPNAAGAASPNAIANSANYSSTGNGVAAVWRDVALASIALWLIALTALAWWWFARRPSRSTAGTAFDADEIDRRRGALRKRLADAAQRGDAAACERALLDCARGERAVVRNSGALREALCDSAQRAALEQLQRARWKGGDARAACDAAVRAFARGFAWSETRDATPRARGELPPLYLL